MNKYNIEIGRVTQDSYIGCDQLVNMGSTSQIVFPTRMSDSLTHVVNV